MLKTAGAGTERGVTMSRQMQQAEDSRRRHRVGAAISAKDVFLISGGIRCIMYCQI